MSRSVRPEIHDDIFRERLGCTANTSTARSAADRRSGPAKSEPRREYARDPRVEENVRQMKRERAPAPEVPVRYVARAHERPVELGRRRGVWAFGGVPKIGRETTPEVVRLVRIRISDDEWVIVEDEAIRRGPARTSRGRGVPASLRDADAVGRATRMLGAAQTSCVEESVEPVAEGRRRE